MVPWTRVGSASYKCVGIWGGWAVLSCIPKFHTSIGAAQIHVPFCPLNQIPITWHECDSFGTQECPKQVPVQELFLCLLFANHSKGAEEKPFLHQKKVACPCGSVCICIMVYYNMESGERRVHGANMTSKVDDVHNSGRLHLLLVHKVIFVIAYDDDL